MKTSAIAPPSAEISRSFGSWSLSGSISTRALDDSACSPLVGLHQRLRLGICKTYDATSQAHQKHQNSDPWIHRGFWHHFKRKTLQHVGIFTTKIIHMFYSQGFAISILMVTAFPTGSYAGTSEAESQRVRRHVQEGPRPVFWERLAYESEIICWSTYKIIYYISIYIYIS